MHTTISSFVKARTGIISAGAVLATVAAFAFVLSAPLSAHAATLQVNSDSTKAGYETAILKAADRLVALQNSDGAWDWVVTDTTAPGASSAHNTIGVTAQALLDAYQITHEAKYLTAAEKAGNYFDDSTHRAQNGFDIVFLYNLGVVSGVGTYTTLAGTMLGNVANSNVWATDPYNGVTCDSTGCTADQLLTAYETWQSGPNDGWVAWSLTPYVEAAKLLGGHDQFQSDLQKDIDNYLSSSSYISSVPNYELGLTAGIKAETLVGAAASSTLLSELAATQDAITGAFGNTSNGANGQVQITAYALTALDAAGNSNAAAANYLSSHFGYTDTSVYNGWKESDGKEYSEQNGEAAHALALLLNADGSTFYIIQDAVNAASSDDTIQVAAGTYNESVLVNKSITLSGSAGAQPVIAGTSTANYILKINNVSGGATVDNFEINGGGTATPDNAFTYGILVNNSGTEANPVTIENSTVKNIWQNGSNGIGAESSSYVLVHNNAISSFHKRGIRFINSNGKFYNNDVHGENVNGVDRVQNLVTVWGGSNVEIYGNTLHNALTAEGSTPLWDSPAVFVSSYGGSGDSHVNVHDNEIYNGDTGIVVGSVYADTDASTADITNNNFHNLNWAINFEQGTASAVVHGNSFTSVNKAVNADDGNDGPATKPTVNATNNWWGAASGPTNATTSPNGTGATIYDEVSFSPWWNDAAMTIPRYTTTTSDGEASTTVATAMASSTTTSFGTVDVDIPAGIVVTGPAAWDGTITLPTVIDTNVAPVADSGNNAASTGSIEVGFGNILLTFDKAVKLTFAGQAGNSIGYSHGAGTFHQITTPCVDNTQATNDLLASGSDCKIHVSGDLVVWTKHFSTFTTYTQTAIPAPAPSGGGGGGGGISYNYSVSINNGATDASSTSVTLTISPAATANQMQVSNTPDFSASTWVTFQSTYPWTLTAGSGTKTVYVRYGSNGSVVANAQDSITLTATSLPVVSTPTTQPQGQVLGAAAYNFRNDFGIGSNGQDVTELQKILIAGGFLNIPAAIDHFGPLTQAAVKKYQQAHGITPLSGYVGPKTRAVLSRGTTPTLSDEQRATFIAQLQAQLQVLLDKIRTIQAGQTQ